MTGQLCPTCGSTLVGDAQDAACPSCGWRPNAADSPKARASYGGKLRDPEYDAAESDALGTAEKQVGEPRVMIEREQSPIVGAVISFGVGMLIGLLWFCTGLLATYTPGILFMILCPIIAVPVCWIYGGAFLGGGRPFWPCFANALAFNIGLALTACAFLLVFRETKDIPAEFVVAYAVLWGICFAVVCSGGGRMGYWLGTWTDGGPMFIVGVGLSSFILGALIATGFKSLFGVAFLNSLTGGLTLAGIFLGAAQTGMEHGW